MYGFTRTKGTHTINRMSDLLQPWNLFDHLTENSIQTRIESMPINITENKDNFCIEAVLPGFKREDVDISYENEILTIKASSQAEIKEEKEELVVLNEFSTTPSYFREFSISDLDIDKAKAILKDGILRLTLPKTEKVKAIQIKVK
jgi:HSP20 family protein